MSRFALSGAEKPSRQRKRRRWHKSTKWQSGPLYAGAGRDRESQKAHVKSRREPPESQKKRENAGDGYMHIMSSDVKMQERRRCQENSHESELKCEESEMRAGGKLHVHSCRVFWHD